MVPGLIPRQSSSLAEDLGEVAYQQLRQSPRYTQRLEEVILPFVPALLAVGFYTECGLDFEVGVDKQLHLRAATNGQQSLGLETASEQMSVFTSISTSQIKTGIAKILSDPELVKTQRDRILMSYIHGDPAGLFAARALLDELNPDIGAQVLEKRETRWLPRVLNLIFSGVPTVVTVGALHLAGEDGLLGRLVAQGVDFVRVNGEPSPNAPIT